MYKIKKWFYDKKIKRLTTKIYCDKNKKYPETRMFLLIERTKYYKKRRELVSGGNYRKVVAWDLE